MHEVFNISNSEFDPSVIASDPFEVCFCDAVSRQPNCSDSNRVLSLEAFPGQDFYIRLAVVGYGYSLLGPGADGTLPGAVRAYLNAPVYATLGQHQVSQIIDKPYCMNLGYSVYTLRKEVTFQLLAEQNFIETVVTEDQSAMLSIRVNLNDCPHGFVLSPATKGCVCSTVIGEGDVRCYIYGQKIFRQANTWLGFKSYGNVIVHHNCLFGYCKPHGDNITINTSDNQCEAHRTGVLCGKCKDGLQPHPWKCEVCKVFQHLLAAHTSIGSGWIASGGCSLCFEFDRNRRLNLNLGISTCLYNGMDGYAATWLQLIYPIYLWMIALAIIVIYRKFPVLANRLGGENAVKFWPLFCFCPTLSYSKL